MTESSPSKPPFVENLADKGYTLIPVPSGSKITKVKNWQEIEGTNLSSPMWSLHKPNVAISCGKKIGKYYIGAIDVDDYTGDFHKTVVASINADVVPVRYGKKPKFLIPFRTTQKLKKNMSKVWSKSEDEEPDKNEQAQIEVLGDGQYFVSHGVHPDTEEEYQWENGDIQHMPIEDLPLLSPGDIQHVIDQFENAAEFGGYRVIKNPKAESMAKSNDIRTLEKMVTDVLPDWKDQMKEHFTKARYKSCTTVMADLIASVPGMRNNSINNCVHTIIRRVYESGFDYAQQEEILEYVRDAIHEACEYVGYDEEDRVTTIESAWTSGEEKAETAVRNSRDLEDNVQEDFVMTPEGKFIQISTMTEFSTIGIERQFKGDWNAELHDEMTISDWLPDSRYGNIPMVHGYGWKPTPYGKDPEVTYKEGNKLLLNEWKGFAVEPVEGDTAPFHEALAHVCQDESEREVFLDRLAFDIQNPHKKCNWIIVILGISGAGKDSILAPLHHIFGDSSAILDMAAMKSEFKDPYIGSKILQVSELNNMKDSHLDDLKQKAASTSKDKISLNRKGQKAIDHPNLWSIYLLTNHRSAIRPSKNERRLFVIEAPDVMPQDMVDRYHHDWLEKGGSAHLMYELLHRDLSDFNPAILPFYTPAFMTIYDVTKLDWETLLDSLIGRQVYPFDKEELLISEAMEVIREEAQRLGQRVPYVSKIKEFLMENGYMRLKISGSQQPVKSKRVDGKVKKHTFKASDTDIFLVKRDSKWGKLEYGKAESYDLIADMKKRDSLAIETQKQKNQEDEGVVIEDDFDEAPASEE